MRDRHHAFGEEVAAIALGAERSFPPEHEGSQLALGVVVRGLDVVPIHECPERRPVRQDVSARGGQPFNLCCNRAFEQRLHLRPQWSDPGTKHFPGQMPRFVVVPVLEQDPRVVEEIAAEGRGWAISLRERDELAKKVSPAYLPNSMAQKV